MNPFRRLLCSLLLVLTLSANAQFNAEMPPVKALVTQFFYSYMEPNDFSSYYFYKKADGWYVSMYDNATGASTLPQLYWSREQHRYLVLDFALQKNPDSAVVARMLADYARRYLLTAEQTLRYDRNLYFGYGGWEHDVIKTLEAAPPTTDSLWETLATAYDATACAAVVPESFRKMGYAKPDIQGFVNYENKAIAALRRILASNPHYQAAFHEIDWQLNTILMATATTLKWLGSDNLAAPFVQAASYPESALQKNRLLLRRLPPNSILFTDKDTTTFPITYLQAKGVRPDIAAIDDLFLLFPETIDKLHKQSLTRIQPSTYLDTAFEIAMYQPDEHDTATHSLDTVLAAVYASPDAPARPKLDPSLGRLYRYFTLHPYLINQKGDHFKIDLPERYLSKAEILDLDIVTTNYLTRRIFFTHPHEHPILEPFCRQISPGLYEFIPNKTPASSR